MIMFVHIGYKIWKWFSIVLNLVFVHIFKDDLVCDVCELVITLLDDELKKNQSEKALNETLYKLCDTLPDALKLLVSIIIQHNYNILFS